MKHVRIGVIGIGVMGRGHLDYISRSTRVKLAAVCDVIPARANEAAKTFGCAAFGNHHDMFKAGLCDAVLIATPHFSHTPIGIDALKAGLHVLVEKPISVHKADCERLIAAHRHKKQVFAAMFNQRTDPMYIKLRKLIQDGELGKLDRICWTITDWFRTQAYYDAGEWRATWAGEGGGVLTNQATHNLDLWQWMFGMPDQIRGFCKIGHKHKIEVEDSVTAYMEYRSGCSGVFITTTGEAPGTNRLEVVGEYGKVVSEGDRLTFFRNEVSTNQVLGKSSEKYSRPPMWEVSIPVPNRGLQHAGIIQNFIDSILTGVELVAPAAEGIRAVEIGNAILYSSENGTTVELPMDGKEYERFLNGKIANTKKGMR